MLKVVRYFCPKCEKSRPGHGEFPLGVECAKACLASGEGHPYCGHQLGTKSRIRPRAYYAKAGALYDPRL